ncbi:MAG: class I SAM-dependent RNA methyltransferase [Betaproteobacteria bacterium]|nr:MAG: class I SAM-dependent RNA methyltransferase [Betaproteobacteria bacterium]
MPNAPTTISIKATPIPAKVQRFFTPCPRGLEQALADELAALGAQSIDPTDGGVGFTGNFTLGYKVCLWSRIASRVLWQLAEAEYRHEEEIYKLARNIDWPHLFSANETIRVQVDAIRSPLTSLEFVTLRVKDAIVDAFRAAMASRPSVNTSQPDMRIHVFLTAYKATVYLDLAGEALFKRGYRREGLAAPLRENLAAGMLALKGWKGQTPLLDPMCGSGTILTEAAMIAMNIAPGAQRPFAFEKLRNYDAETFAAMRDKAQSEVRPLPANLLFGNDLNTEAIDVTKRHLQNIGGAATSDAVTLTQQRAETLTKPAASGLLLTNPPYGERMEELASLKAWYPALGAWLKREMAGWKACFITADRELPSGLGFKPNKKTPLFNGALDCRLFEIELYAGSKREPKPQGGMPLEHQRGFRERS